MTPVSFVRYAYAQILEFGMPRRNHREDHVPLVAPDLSPEPPLISRQRRQLHPAHQARLDREAARRALTTCAMPMCNAPVMYDDEAGGLGICFGCAIDVAHHFKKLGEVKPLTERQLQREFRQRAAAQRKVSEQEARAIEPGWIYYVRVTDRIKIGFSTDVRKRMRAYPPHAELLAVHPGTPTLEREMHAKFAGHLAQGREWFRPDAEVMAHIDDVVEQFGPVPKHMIYTFREGTPQRIKPHRRSRR